MPDGTAIALADASSIGSSACAWYARRSREWIGDKAYTLVHTTSGVAGLVIHRQCLGPPHVARVVVLSLLQHHDSNWQVGHTLIGVVETLFADTIPPTPQNPEETAPSINPVSLQFSSIEAERRFRAQHLRTSFPTCLSFDVVYAILHFGLLVPCLSAYGLDNNPRAPATVAYRLSTLGSSAFVLLGVGPLALVAAHLAWFRVHHISVRYGWSTQQHGVNTSMHTNPDACAPPQIYLAGDESSSNASVTNTCSRSPVCCASCTSFFCHSNMYHDPTTHAENGHHACLSWWCTRRCCNCSARRGTTICR